MFVQILLLHIQEELFNTHVLQQRWLPILGNGCVSIGAGSIPHRYSLQYIFYKPTVRHFLSVSVYPSRAQLPEIKNCNGWKELENTEDNPLLELSKTEKRDFTHMCFSCFAQIGTSPCLGWVNTQNVERVVQKSAGKSSRQKNLDFLIYHNIRPPEPPNQTT